jgi:hypothetical protein
MGQVKTMLKVEATGNKHNGQQNQDKITKAIIEKFLHFVFPS